MAFGVGGVFIRVHNFVTDRNNGVKILSERMDEEIDGIATGLSGCITKNGLTTPTQNLPMGTYRHTGAGDAEELDEYATAGQVVGGALTWCGSAGGTANALTLTPAIAITAYAAGQRFSFVAASSNTGAATLAVSGLVTKAIQRDGAALTAGMVASGKPYEVIYDGTQFQLIPLHVPVPAAAPTPTPQHGQCRLAKSGSNLVLSPYNGNKLTINGVERSIPSGGVSLAPGSVTPGTTYYIYAYMNSSTMTLEASTTGHATHTDGVEIKSGDATRTLVGMARPVTGPAWADGDAQRLVVSWFNRRAIRCNAAFTALRSTTSTTPTRLSSEIQLEWLAWGDAAVTLQAHGYKYNSGNSYIYSAFGVDSTSTVASEVGASANYASSAQGGAFALSAYPTPSEGYHTSELLGYVSGGTGNWDSVTRHNAVIMG